MIEIIMVIALLGFVYSVVIPGFRNVTGVDVANQLNQFGGGIRAAYDYAVLYQRNVRLRIDMHHGRYWLEEAAGDVVRIPNDPVEIDLSPEEEKEAAENFKVDFEKYLDLAGEAVPDLDDDEKQVSFESPVIRAQKRLQPTTWTRVDSSEWRGLNLGEALIVRLVQTDHLSTPVLLDDYGQEAVVSLYFFPDGRTEQALFHIYYKLSDGVPDTEQLPYSVLVNPFTGLADVLNGVVEWEQYSEAVREGKSFEF